LGASLHLRADSLLQQIGPGGFIFSSCWLHELFAQFPCSLPDFLAQFLQVRHHAPSLTNSAPDRASCCSRSRYGACPEARPERLRLFPVKERLSRQTFRLSSTDKRFFALLKPRVLITVGLDNLSRRYQPRYRVTNAQTHRSALPDWTTLVDFTPTDNYPTELRGKSRRNLELS